MKTFDLGRLALMMPGLLALAAPIRAQVSMPSSLEEELSIGHLEQAREILAKNPNLINSKGITGYTKSEIRCRDRLHGRGCGSSIVLPALCSAIALFASLASSFWEPANNSSHFLPDSSSSMISVAIISCSSAGLSLARSTALAKDVVIIT